MKPQVTIFAKRYFNMPCSKDNLDCTVLLFFAQITANAVKYAKIKLAMTRFLLNASSQEAIVSLLARREIGYGWT
jgi:hypothetical protein